MGHYVRIPFAIVFVLVFADLVLVTPLNWMGIQVGGAGFHSHQLLYILGSLSLLNATRIYTRVLYHLLFRVQS